MIGFGDAVARYYKNYFNFSGRATRSEYWWPLLMQLIVYLALVVAFLSSIGIENSASDDMSGAPFAIILAGLLFMIFNTIPGYAVSARRFHDLDQTGWLVLVFVIANAFIVVSAFAQLIWFCIKGTDGPNKYGPDPYGYEADVFG